RYHRAPFPTGPDVLVVAYFATAEMGCFLALGWPLPANLLDAYVEFANVTNGQPLPSGRGLLGALVYFGLTGVSYAEKEAMRQLPMRGGPYTEEEVRQLLAYCQSDVLALRALLPAMEPFDLGCALLRGRYMQAAARMEACGTPIDTETLQRLRANWDAI